MAVVFLAAGTVAATAAITGLLPAASASSHREAPLIAADPAVDNTDVYAFTSPDRPDTVTLIANWQALRERPTPRNALNQDERVPALVGAPAFIHGHGHGHGLGHGHPHGHGPPDRLGRGSLVGIGVGE